MSDFQSRNIPQGTIVGTIDPKQAGGAGTQGQAGPMARLIASRHPDWTLYHNTWIKWRLAYNGGEEFVKEYLQKYHDESPFEYARRRSLTFNPPHSLGVVNTIRDAFAVKLPDVERDGSEEYLDWCATNVDRCKSSMSTFVGEQVFPEMLALQICGVWMDSPLRSPDEDLAAARARMPFLFTIRRENVLSWYYDPETNELLSFLCQEWVPVRNEWGLVVDVALRYRYAELIRDYFGIGNNGVRVMFIDKDGHLTGDNIVDPETAEPKVFPLSRIPFVEFSIPKSLMEDIADMQTALMNLNSCDVDFLFKQNFPVWTEQIDAELEAERELMAAKNHDGSQESADNNAIGKKRTVGSSRGVAYDKGLNAPDFVAPSPEPVRVSMEKQTAIATDIRVVSNVALTSMSVAALEQSGASKEADRIGLEASLAFLASVVETGEKDIAVLFHEMMGIPVESSVTYPRNFNVKTDAENRAEAKELIEIRDAVPISEFQKEMNKRIAAAALRGHVGPEVEAGIDEAIDDHIDWDTSVEHANAMTMHRQNGLVTSDLASVLMGFPEGQAALARDQKAEDLDSQLAGFLNRQPTGVNANGANVGGDGQEGDASPAGNTTNAQDANGAPTDGDGDPGADAGAGAGA